MMSGEMSRSPFKVKDPEKKFSIKIQYMWPCLFRYHDLTNLEEDHLKTISAK